MLILFVCTGNTCRSPLAELYFNELCRQRGCLDVSAESAGICAVNGSSISENSARILQMNDIPINGFQSRNITTEMIEEADLIVTMGRSHKNMLLNTFPQTSGKVRLLMEFAGEQTDVPDPFGGSVECYRDVFQQMKTPLEKLAEIFLK